MSVLDLLPKIKLEHEGEVRKKVAIGTAIGLTVGAVAGVLLAPKAGKETRDDLAKTIDELPGKVKEFSDRAHKMGGEAAGEIFEETLAGFNEDILKGQWHELKGGIKAKWGKLTDDELTIVDGESEKLMGIIQTKYGYSKDRVKEEFDDFINAHKK